MLLKFTPDVNTSNGRRFFRELVLLIAWRDHESLSVYAIELCLFLWVSIATFTSLNRNSLSNQGDLVQVWMPIVIPNRYYLWTIQSFDVFSDGTSLRRDEKWNVLDEIEEHFVKIFDSKNGSMNEVHWMIEIPTGSDEDRSQALNYSAGGSVNSAKGGIRWKSDVADRATDKLIYSIISTR